MRLGVLIISICLNLTLMGLAFNLIRKPGPNPAPGAVRPVPAGSPTADHAPIPVTNHESPITVGTNAFHWRMLEPSDYDRFVANLRHVGCPKKTIRDIIVGDVEKLYAARIATIPVHAGFWSAESELQKAGRRQQQQQRSLEEQKRALLQRLLETDERAEGREGQDLIQHALLRFLLGPLPDGAYARLLAAMARGERQAGEVENQFNSLLLPEDEARIRKIHEQNILELQGLLAPQQFEEFAARITALNLMDRGFENFRMTAAELRQIARMHIEVFGLFEGKPFEFFASDSQPSEAKSEEFQTRLKAFLGEARYGEYQQGNDPAFRSAQQVAEQSLLPEDTASKVYQIKQLATAERQRLQADGTLSAPERDAQLRQAQDSVRTEMQNLLGADGLTEYFRRGSGAWVTNFAR